jgi:hypothetical protein
MNLNNFFVDKLNNGQLIDQPNNISKTGSNLFSDIINVCDEENLQLDPLMEFVGQSNTKELFSPSENVIYTSASELEALSNYITDFLKTKPQILVSESSYDLQSVEVNKKILDINKKECEDFITGLLNNILKSSNKINELTNQEISDLKSTLQNDLLSNDEGIKRVLEGLMSNLLSENAFEPDKEILKISTDELEQTYNSTSSKSLTTALVNYLENNSILNLTFKHNFNKVSINFAATDTKLGKAKVELLQASDQNYAKNVLLNENLFENNKNLELRDIKAEVVEITEINSGENKALVNHLLAKGTQLINTFRLQSDVAKLTANPISGLKQSDMNLEDVPSFKAVENSLHYKISEIENTLKTAPVEKTQKNNIDVEVTSKSTEPSNSTNNNLIANPKSAAALTNIEGTVNYKFQNLDASISKKLDVQNLAAQNVNITSDEIFQELNLEKVEINGESAKILKTSDSKAASDVKTPIELKTEAGVNDAIKISMKKSGDADEGKVTLTAKENTTSNTILESTKGFQEVENVIVKTKSRIIAENIKIENSSLVNESEKVSGEKNVVGLDKAHPNSKVADGYVELSLNIERNDSYGSVKKLKLFNDVENIKAESKITADNIKIENSSLVKDSGKVSEEKNVTGDDKVHSNKKIVDGDLELSAKKDQNENNPVNKELTGLASKEKAELKFKSEIVNLPVDFKSVKKADVSESVKAANSEKESINAKVELSASENSSSSEGSTSFGGDKEMNRQNGHELNKSSISHAPSFINDLEGERLKVFSELKQMHESFKVIKPAELFNEIGKMINGTEKQSLTFQLNPENLGKIKLMVDFVDNQLVTRIEVENEQVKHFIQSNIETLKQQLTSSGIQLSNVSVSLADYDQKNNKPFAPKKKSSSRVVNENSDEDILKSEKRILGYNTLEYLV